MASCAQIEHRLQAYIDDELLSAERVVVEHHMNECPKCASALRRQRRTAASMFEAFSADRLSQSLRRKVLENLPEIIPADTDLAGVNWRAKHPSYWIGVLAKGVPVAVAAILVISFFILKEKWPISTASGTSVGVVAQCLGQGWMQNEEEAGQGMAKVCDFVRVGNAYETGAKSGILLALMGPTSLKLNENTRISIEHERRIRLEQGEIWLHVGRDGRLFRVMTPNGNVTVYGTTFAVSVKDNRTLVTVEEGQVKVDNETPVFRMLRNSQQVEMEAGAPVSAPASLNETPRFAWAEGLVPQEKAGALFESQIMPHSKSTELPAKDLFWIDASVAGRHWKVNAVRLSWATDGQFGGHCGYTAYIYDEKWNPITKEAVPAATFNDREHTMYEIPIPPERTEKAGDLIIELVPDYSQGTVETPIRVTASGS